MAGLFDLVKSSFGSGFGFQNPALSRSIGNVGNYIRQGAGGLGTGSGWSWFGNNGIIPVGLAGLQTLGGLGDLWLGFQNYNLAKDAYDFQTALANRNLSNQAKIINNVYDVAGRVGAALSNQNWDGTVDKNALAASEEQAKRQHVDGSYIG